MQQPGPAAPAPRRKRKKRGSPLVGVLIVLLLGGMCFAGWQLFTMFLGYHQDKQTFDEVADQVVTLPASAAAADSQAAEPVPWPTIDWQALQALNPEVVGWLYCPDTVINYPVMQTTDNDYYLKHSVDNSANEAGTPFADYQAVLGPTLCNYIVYGHYRQDGSMFQSLSNYTDQEYYDEHPLLYFLTPTTVYRVDLIGGSVVESVAENYPLVFADEAAYQQYIDKVTSHSYFTTHAEVSTQYQMMSLSTCNYSRNFNDPRMQLHGLMVPVG